MGLFSGGYSGGFRGFLEETNSYLKTGSSVGTSTQESREGHKKRIKQVAECAVCNNKKPESCVKCAVKKYLEDQNDN